MSKILVKKNSPFKIDVEAQKDLFLNEGGYEIYFYFLTSYNNHFDQLLKVFNKKKRNYFQER